MNISISYDGSLNYWHCGTSRIPIAKVNDLAGYPNAVLYPATLPWSSACAMCNQHRPMSYPALTLLADRNDAIASRVNACDLSDKNKIPISIRSFMETLAHSCVEVPDEFIRDVCYWVEQQYPGE